MPARIRPAETSDIDAMADLMLRDAEARQAGDGILWAVEPNAPDKIRSALRSAMDNETPPFRQQWLLAEGGDGLLGLTHTILLPVPPIYAGELGAPGLIMEDCCVVDPAPHGTRAALLRAAEADLKEAGAKILLASSVPAGPWAAEYLAQDYEPLTLYLAKVGPSQDAPPQSIRKASEKDVPAIVAASADNRQVLFDLNPRFWKPHPEADARFDAWMRRSLTLTDRDMFVHEAEGGVDGYAISQPVTPLHLPTAHRIGGIGIIDDLYHPDLEDPATLRGGGPGVTALLQSAEAARASRGDQAVLVVCPAAWASRIALLEAAGYRNAITWFIKR